MEKNLESQLATVLEKALQVAEQTGEFVIEQAPDVLKEFYLWNIVDYSVGILFYTILLVVIILVIRYFGIRDEWEFDDGALVATAWVGGAFGLFSLWALYYNISKLLQIWLAPKFYLVEYLLTLS